MSRRNEMTSNIGLSSWLREEPDERRREGGPEDVGDEHSRPRAADEKPPVLQFGDGVSERRPGDPEPLGKLAFRRKTLRPGRRMPSRMRSSICRTTLWESFSGWNFLETALRVDLGDFRE